MDRGEPNLARRKAALVALAPPDTHPRPWISGASPAQWAEGDVVTLTGSGFRVRSGRGYADNVYVALFGQSSVPGTSLTVLSDTTLTVVAPAAPGTLLWLRALGGDAVVVARTFTGQLGTPRSYLGNLELGVP